MFCVRCNSCGQMPKSLVVLCWFHQSEVSGGACTAAPINAAGLQTSALQHAITTPVDTILSHLIVNNDILPGNSNMPSKMKANVEGPLMTFFALINKTMKSREQFEERN